MGAEPGWGLSTLSVHGAGPGTDAERLTPSTPTVQPIYQTSVYSFPDLASLDAVQDGTAEGYIYGRYGLPNHTALERAVAALEGGEAALACASGMGATAAALLAALSGGGKVAAARDVYGGTYGLLEELGRFGVKTVWVDAGRMSEVEAALAEGCRLLLVETISNPLVKVADLPALAAAAHRAGAFLLVDNTFATPCLCRPLSLGADAVYHSATKFLGGHSDLTAGVLVGTAPFIRDARRVAMRFGPTLGPHDAWLAVRGMKTLDLRMARTGENALVLATFLAKHPKVAAVRQAGTIAAIELAASDAGYLSALAPRLKRFYLSRGALLRPLGNVVYLLPPYCSTEADLRGTYDLIEESLALA
ncbi:MAG: aminotransferase class I/II-fold pyridoxal phosphate-dependent enzyme [candidate division NC10 bacterium]|nr:aminotransferase class I/II-fold pyridoxal phosphate-dependent enzyme [candidate division NC10 bacterium]